MAARADPRHAHRRGSPALRPQALLLRPPRGRQVPGAARARTAARRAHPAEPDPVGRRRARARRAGRRALT
ncbi:hypothetical protein ACFSTC_04105 [Nonomuraea ferruginea]